MLLFWSNFREQCSKPDPARCAASALPILQAVDVHAEFLRGFALREFAGDAVGFEQFGNVHGLGSDLID